VAVDQVAGEYVGHPTPPEPIDSAPHGCTATIYPECVAVEEKCLDECSVSTALSNHKGLKGFLPTDH